MATLVFTFGESQKWPKFNSREPTTITVVFSNRTVRLVVKCVCNTSMVLGSKEEMLDLTQTTRENFFVGVRELYLSNKITYFNILNFLSTFRSHACL